MTFQRFVLLVLLMLCFTATGTAGPLASFEIKAENGNDIGSQTAGQPFSVRIRALDANDNVVTGFDESVVITSTGNFAAVGTQTTIGFSNGVLNNQTVTITNTGNFTLTVAGSGITGTSNAFDVNAAKIEINDGNNQTTTAGAAVATAPRVIVLDANEPPRPLAGVSVTFAVTSGGGSITGATTTTDAAGIAAVGSWTLGTTVGTNTLAASVAGLTNVTFTATGTAGVATQVAIQAGDAQTATVGTAVANAPSVIVRDVNNNLVEGVSVTFSASGNGVVAPTTATTGADGIAAVTSWTLSTTAGSNTLTATITDSAPAISTTFTATGTAAAATQVAIQAGDGQTATVGTAVANAPSVIVRDEYDNPITDVSVTFAVDTGGGSITGETATTDADGIAAVGSWTLSTTAGSNTLTATITDSEPAISTTFNATGTAGTATQIAINSGNNQLAMLGTAVTTAPSVIVRDASDNPVAGVSVTFEVDTGGGSITGATATTNAAGIASVGSWTLGNTAGSNTLTSTAAGLTGSPITFNATGTDARFEIKDTDGNDIGSQTAGQPFSVRIRALDASGNLLKDFNESVSLTSTGMFATQGTTTIGGFSNGVLNNQTVRITNTGNFTLTVAGSGITGTSNAFDVHAAKIEINDGNNQTATAGAAVATAPSVIVRDANNNPLAGVSVTFAVATGGGNITGAAATTDEDGIAAVGSWTLGTTVGTNTLAASVAGLTNLTFTATGTAGVATQVAIQAGDAQTATVGSEVANAPNVIVRDVNNNLVEGVSVTFSASGNGVVAPTTATTGADGIAAVTSWTLSTTAGSNTLTATITDSEPAISTTFTATGTAGVAAAGSSTISANPTSIVADGVSTSTITVQLKDANGNNLTTGGAAVFLSTSAGTLGGVTDVGNGSYTATLTSEANAGTATVTAYLGEDANAPEIGTTNVNFTVGTPTQLAITTQPVAAASGSPLATQPVIEIQDAAGNRVEGATSAVTVDIFSGEDGSLGGSQTVNAVNGTATFADLSLSGVVGNAYVLRFSSATLTQVDSIPVSVTGAGAASATTSTVTADPTSLEANGTATSTLTVQLRDANGNNLTTGGATVTFAAPGANQGTIDAVTDNNNGTYTATYTAGTLAGSVTITPSVDGEAFTNTTSITLTINPDLQAALDAAVAQANGLNQNDYTSASWTELQAALNLPQTTNAEVVAKTTAINAAIDALVTADAATVLANAKAAAAALTEADYTAASWTVLQNALGLAEATPAEIAAKTSAINDAIAGLVFAGQAALDAAVGQATGLTQNDYTPASWTELQNALALPETTNAEVVAKTTAINAAISGLVSADAATALANAKAAAAALTEADYTAASWTVLQNALGLAEATPAEIAVKTSAINDAIAGLVFAGQADLDAAVAQANGLNQNDYTPASWTALQAALNLPQTTNAEVVAKTTAINAAIDALVTATTTLTPPSAPTITGVSRGDGTLTIHFTPPVNSGGADISSYEVQTNEAAWEPVTPTDNQVVLSGLTNGKSYTVSIRAVNAIGPGEPSVSVTASPGVSNVDFAQTTISVEGGEVVVAGPNAQVPITLQLRGLNGEPLLPGTIVFASTTLGTLSQNPSGPSIPMRDNGDGSYSVLLKSEQPGVATVSFDVNGQNAGSVDVRFNASALGVRIEGPTALESPAEFEVTVTFDRDVTGFLVDDLVLSNGTALRLSGGPQVYTATIRPNQSSAALSVLVPAGVATATDGSDDLNQASNELTINADPTVEQTRRAIASFMLGRANNLASNQPSLARLLEREGSGCDYLQASGSERQAVGKACATLNRNLWMDVTGSWARNKSTYALVSVGSHARLSPDLLVGGMTQFDYADDPQHFTRGSGWLIGPYFAARHPTHPLRFEGRLLYGQTRNDISPKHTYRDRFDTRRWLLQFATRGDIHSGRITWSPVFDLTYVTDRQLSYRDSLGNLIDGQSVQLMQSTAGLEFRVDVPVNRGSLSVDGGLSGVYSATSGGTIDFARQRARASLGLQYHNTSNSRLRIQGFVDGLGTHNRSHGISTGFEWLF